MKLDRRQFIALGIGGTVGAACRYVVDPARPNMVAHISGLCALVRGQSRSGGLDLLMLNGSNAGLDQHFPRLMTSPANVPDDLQSAMQTTTFLGQTYAFWDLDGYEVTISPTKSGRLSAVSMPRKRVMTEKTPKEDMFGDVSWIPHMSRLTPGGRVDMNPICLAPDPTPIVAGRVLFTYGELSSIFPLAPADFKKIEFAFNPPPAAGSYQQALADAQLLQQLPGGAVTFTLTPFKPGKPQRQIKLVTGALGTGALHVLLTNMPKAKPPDCRNGDEVVQTLHHFSAYYGLLDDKKVKMPNMPVPKYVGGAPLQCKSTDEFIRCPPIIF